VQRGRFLAKIETHFHALGAEAYCRYLAELGSQKSDLIEAAFVQQQAAAQVNTVTLNLNYLQARPCAHVLRGLRELEESGVNDSVLRDLRYARIFRPLNERQRKVLQRVPLAFGAVRWIEIKELLDALGRRRFSTKELKQLKRQSIVGIQADPESLTGALNGLIEFMQRWTGKVQCSVQRSSNDLFSLSVVGKREAVDRSDLFGLVNAERKEPPMDMCGMTPELSATIIVSALQIRAIGGEVRLEPEGRRSKKSQQYRLTVELPLEGFPL